MSWSLLVNLMRTMFCAAQRFWRKTYRLIFLVLLQSPTACLLSSLLPLLTIHIHLLPLPVCGVGSYRVVKTLAGCHRELQHRLGDQTCHPLIEWNVPHETGNLRNIRRVSGSVCFIAARFQHTQRTMFHSSKPRLVFAHRPATLSCLLVGWQMTNPSLNGVAAAAADNGK